MKYVYSYKSARHVYMYVEAYFYVEIWIDKYPSIDMTQGPPVKNIIAEMQSLSRSHPVNVHVTNLQTRPA